ncbi:GNAT family N-acetyltransferase [Streptomyces sp. NPDC050560]|uniref:GNAT family N-acetyltransferase n=1 Tax=Streptomyces sp. NPDC050560 TaxID=3365630 RepID=UPI00379F75E5
MLATPESVLFDQEHAHPDAHATLLVAEEAGEIIGTAQVAVAHESPRPGIGTANVYTHPGREGRGAGLGLLRAAERLLAGLGVTRVYAWVPDEPRHRAFAARRGYRPSRSAHFLRLDLTAAALPERPLPPGVSLCTAADFAADPRPLFDLDAATVRDEPGDVASEFDDYAHWLTGTWRHPLLDRGLTSVAVAGGRPVAFSVAYTDGAGRYLSAMTGTLREFRGRGLAALAKADSLRRARDAGCTEAYTGNDAQNAPMLAVNARLGYRVTATEVRHVRELTADSGPEAG